MRHVELIEDFPEQLNVAIGKSGLHIKEVAKRAGLSRSQIYRYLSGEAAPTLLAAAKLAKCLGVQIDIFVKH